jgi:hypothetical protein
MICKEGVLSLMAAKKVALSDDLERSVTSDRLE